MPRFVAVDWNGTVVPFFCEPAYPGALETLARWRREGVLVAVVSHAHPATIEADVARTGLEADEVHGVEEKAPAFLELRLRHGHGVVIGDHPADLRAADAAGLPFYQACLEGQRGMEGRVAAFSDWQELDLLLRAADA
jgi:beta-phosphoglucomutase-like phosphatase (HAD superfamily)